MKLPIKRQSRITSRITDTAGLPPGTPVFVGQQKQDTVQIDIIDYTEQSFNEILDAGLDDCLRFKNSPSVTWININGIHDVAVIEKLGEQFSLHPLTREDIVNTNQRPKVEEFDTYLFLVLKMVTYDEPNTAITIENVSLILREGFVLSFQEHTGDVFETIRQRIRTAKGRIRKVKADYLAYALMDAVVDEYFIVLEKIGERIEMIDDDIVTAPVMQHMQEIHRLKRDILFLRKSVWPLREEITAIGKKGDSPLIDDSTTVFMRDLYDHTIQVIDMVETYRDILGGMHDTYLSSVNNRMNDIMKVLTVIATIFIPLTFIAGIYGMNFEHMPELHWAWGYYFILGIMSAIGIGMLVYFKKRKWL